MKSSSTFVGLLVLALVTGGVFWARSRSAAPQMTPAGAATSAPVTSAAADDASLPDATLADATATAGDVRITLSLMPQPPVAFGKMRVRVSADAHGAPVVLDGGVIFFEMKMPMGDHRYSLVPGDGGRQEAEVVLPLCPSGNRRWYATVEGTVAGRPVTARFRLDLTPPK